jgi:hypothetical protein
MDRKSNRIHVNRKRFTLPIGKNRRKAKIKINQPKKSGLQVQCQNRKLSLKKMTFGINYLVLRMKWYQALT